LIALCWSALCLAFALSSLCTLPPTPSSELHARTGHYPGYASVGSEEAPEG